MFTEHSFTEGSIWRRLDLMVQRQGYQGDSYKQIVVEKPEEGGCGQASNKNINTLW